MTTREELIDGFRMIVREGLRTTSDLGPDGWKKQVHGEEGGWTIREIYCHLGATADIVPGFVGALSQASEGADTAGGLDIDSLNAQGVAAREKMSASEVMEAFKSSHEKLIEFIRGMPDEQLRQQGRFGPLDAPLADIMATLLVLHGLQHVYHAAMGQ
jgi:hypothetical protein